MSSPDTTGMLSMVKININSLGFCVGRHGQRWRNFHLDKILEKHLDDWTVGTAGEKKKNWKLLR